MSFFMKFSIVRNRLSDLARHGNNNGVDDALLDTVEGLMEVWQLARPSNPCHKDMDLSLLAELVLLVDDAVANARAFLDRR